jgi:hypothetical protein
VLTHFLIKIKGEHVMNYEPEFLASLITTALSKIDDLAGNRETHEGVATLAELVGDLFYVFREPKSSKMLDWFLRENPQLEMWVQREHNFFHERRELEQEIENLEPFVDKVAEFYAGVEQS